MLRKLLGKDTDSFSSSEEAAVSRLITTFNRLVMDGGRVNTKSEGGYSACAMFLDSLDTGSRTLQIDPAPRSYRVAFTINYRALFPDEARNYRVDVLEASVEQHAVIWVNGDKFEFSAEAMRRAEALQHAWLDLGAILERSHQALENPRIATVVGKSELRAAMITLDFAWARFEHKYIAELIEIEEKARRLILQAVGHDSNMQLIENEHGQDGLQDIPEYTEEQRLLVACIARINSVANFRRKGRDDLRADVLRDALQTLHHCNTTVSDGEMSANALSAARTLATDVVESFIAMREYLREVEKCLERVDPHLCNNVGLVARLVDWEESWEVGTRYVQQAPLLSAVCDLVAQIRVAQKLVPSLTAMCDECDVELFMVLPRIIWLRFFARPDKDTALLKNLLPHRFQDDGLPYPDMVNMIDKYNKAKRAILIAQPGFSDVGSWETLVKRVVAGCDGMQEFYSGVKSGPLADNARTAVEDLMHDLESWSIELQRHCPEDWNQCSAILVQCLTQGKERKESTFHV